MKKSLLTLFLFVVALLCCFSGCSESTSLSSYVSELKTCVYEGQGERYKLQASYGFREEPFQKNGKVGKTVYKLTIKLLETTEVDSTFTLSFDFNGTDYEKNLSLSQGRASLSAEFEIEGFDKKEFTVNLSKGNERETITLRSIIPNDTITFDKALLSLEKSQSKLLENYYDENKFNAELHLRIVVKDGKAYWYVGIATEKDLKALLIDGNSGEVLAIRNVF